MEPSGDAQLRSVVQRPRVAFLGPLASYSHQAVIGSFPESQWDLAPTASIKEIFDVVEAGHAAYGVVPFENSSHGTVMFTLDNLADRHNTYPSLHVCAEIYLDVHHFLLGRKDPSAPPPPAPSSSDLSSPPSPPRRQPLYGLGHVRRVFSHPQAFGQTTGFVTEHLPAAETVDVSSTSRAAEMAAADPSGASAAIAGEVAASAHGLDVLARCIEDHENNTTRFFVLRKSRRREGDEGDDDDDDVGSTLPALPEHLTRVEDRRRRGATPAEEGVADDELPSPFKSLVSFTVPTRAPGALADVLDCFRRHRVNLTSINSLPSLIQPFQYLFFVEFEGSRLVDPDGRVKAALDEIGRVAQRSRWLGSWANQRS